MDSTLKRPISADQRTTCRSCALRERDCFLPFAESDLAFMETFKIGELNVDAGTTILMEGAPSPQLFTVLDGMGLRYKYLPDGRRQVLNFALPGDFVGLQSAVMGEMGHSVESSTAMRLCVFDRAGLWDLFRNSPNRAYSLTWIAAREEDFLGQTLATIGQRNAVSRMAWALVLLWDRLCQLGLKRSGYVPMPWRQRDLADALGLSLVHTNKTIAGLRARGLLSWTDNRLSLPNRDGLAELTGEALEPPGPRPLL